MLSIQNSVHQRITTSHDLASKPYEDSAVVMASESTLFAVARVAVAGRPGMTGLRWTREVRYLN